MQTLNVHGDLLDDGNDDDDDDDDEGVMIDKANKNYQGKDRSIVFLTKFRSDSRSDRCLRNVQ